MRGAVLGVLVGALAAASCSPAVAPAATTAETADPATLAMRRVLVELEAVADMLDTAIARCKDSCCIEAQPWWRTLRSLDAGRRGALRGLVPREQRPRIRALAIHWLGAARQSDDLPVIERFVDSMEPAWREPVPVLSQAVRPCYPMATVRTLTVGEVALGALQRITGKLFRQVADYRAWRRAYAAAADSISYWQRRIGPSVGTAECGRAIAELGSRDAALLVRLAVATWHRFRDPAPTCPRIQQLVPILRARYGQERLLRDLRAPSSWRADRDADYAKDTDWRHLAIWMLANAEALFEPSYGDAVVALTELDAVIRDPEILGHAAVAAGRFHPEARDKIMDAALPRLFAPPPAFVQELARYRPRHPAVKKWFIGRPSADDDERFRLELVGEPISEAAARGLCSAGKQGIAEARALAIDPASHTLERPGLIRTLVEGAVAAGAPPEQFGCEQHLLNICHKVSSDVCQSRKQEEQVARRTCLAAFGRWARRIAATGAARGR